MPRVGLSLADIGIYAFRREDQAKDPKINTQYMINVDHFRDPIGHVAFKGMDGRDPEVREWMKEDRRLAAILTECAIIAVDHIRKKSGRWLSIGFVDHHGKWISAALAEIITEDLASRGFKVAAIHDWDRGGRTSA